MYKRQLVTEQKTVNELAAEYVANEAKKGNIVSNKMAKEKIIREEINETLKDRIELMQEVAEKQDEELTGGEKGKILAYKREQIERARKKVAEEIKKVETGYKGTAEEKVDKRLGRQGAFAGGLLGRKPVGRPMGMSTKGEKMQDLKYQERILFYEGIKAKIMAKMGPFIDKIKKGFKIITTVAKLAGKTLMWMPMIILGLFALFLVVKELWPGIKGAFEMAIGMVSELWESAAGFIGGMWDGVMTIWEGFQEGNILKVVGGILEFFGNLLALSITAAIGVAMLVLGLAIGFIKGIYGDVVGKANSWQGAILRMALKILKVVGGILFLAALRNALINPGMWGPVLIAGLVLVFAALAEKFFNKFDWFSKGGVSTGGLAVVGERGPEMVKLPAGSRVKNNADTLSLIHI